MRAKANKRSRFTKLLKCDKMSTGSTDIVSHCTAILGGLYSMNVSGEGRVSPEILKSPPEKNVGLGLELFRFLLYSIL